MLDIRENMSFKDITSFKTGGAIKGVVYPKNIGQLKDFIMTNKEYLVIGNGTNILASDNYFNNYVIKLDKLKKTIKQVDEYFIVSSNVTCSEFCKYVKDKNYTGCEFLSTIPAQIGGAVTMNAGCFHKEIKDIFYKGIFLDKNGNTKVLSNRELRFKYRSSVINEKELILLYAVFKLGKSNYNLELENKHKQFRLDNQPKGLNAGSVFVNPSKELPAWKLIDQLGLRGYKVNGAMISEKHCNFIINYDNANSTDIYNIIQKVQEDVKKEYDITLESELILINF